MNRVLMFFQSIEIFSFSRYLLPERILICLVGLSLKTDCLIKNTKKKEHGHIILLIAVCSSL